MDTIQDTDVEQQNRADLWREIASTRFAGHRRNTQVHPGYIGTAYRPKKGLLFIGMKRGGNEDCDHDRGVLADIKGSPSLDAYHALNENVWQAIMKGRWPLVGPINLVLKGLGLPPEAVAMINAVPFQVNETPPDRLYLDVWDISTKRQVALIDPGAVVFLGKRVWEVLGGKISVPCTYVNLKRDLKRQVEVDAALERFGFREKARSQFRDAS